MIVKGIHLSSITVKDIDKAIKFFTETVGLTVKEYDNNYKWAELSGPDGAILGLCQENADYEQKAGSNATVCITVDDLKNAKKIYVEKGVRMVGDIVEIPGEVKMQSFVDPDGNSFVLCEKLN